MMNAEASIYGLAAKQGGVVHRDQILEAGLSRHKIDNRVKSGLWTPVSRRGYRLIVCDGAIELVRAAVAVLPSAVASHFSAALVHGMDYVPVDDVSVTVHARTTHSFPGVRVFRCRDLLDRHFEDREGVRVTTLDRTVVDLAAVLSVRHLEVVVDDLLASRRTTIGGVEGVLDDVARKGKPGTRTMRSVLENRSAVDYRLSRLERQGIRILRQSGLVPFEVEYPIPWNNERRYDVAFVSAQLAIEWDSFRWHVQASAFQSDKERDREAIDHGWRILRFTWKDVTEHPDVVVATVRSVLTATGTVSMG